MTVLSLRSRILLTFVVSSALVGLLFGISAIVFAYLVYAWEKMNNGKVHDIVIYPVAYLILFVLVVQTRLGFENFNSAFIFGNPIYVAFQEDPRPLIELYHSIFGVYGNR
jgi:hypothetical protein